MIKNREIRELLRQVLEKDPTKRISTIEIIENAWLTRNEEDPIDLDLESVSQT